MPQRLMTLAAVFLLCAGYLAGASRAEGVPAMQPLAGLPLTIAGWQGHEAPRLSANIERVLGADDYVNRIYAGPGEAYVSLYLGYYASQRQGDTIHSPMNCLPGAGWQPVAAGRSVITVGAPERVIEVNRYVIEKGADRQVVLYWYQSRGRVVASEYWSKAYMISDAIRLNRTDAALVRVISPVLPDDSDEDAATARATAFVESVFPLLAAYLPS